MFRNGVRTFATSALRMVEVNPHTIAVSKAQGIARGLTGGKVNLSIFSILFQE